MYFLRLWKLNSIFYDTEHETRIWGHMVFTREWWGWQGTHHPYLASLGRHPRVVGLTSHTPLVFEVTWSSPESGGAGKACTARIWGHIHTYTHTYILLKQDYKKYNCHSNKNTDGLVNRFASNMVILNQAHMVAWLIGHMVFTREWFGWQVKHHSYLGSHGLHPRVVGLTRHTPPYLGSHGLHSRVVGLTRHTPPYLGSHDLHSRVVGLTRHTPPGVGVTWSSPESGGAGKAQSDTPLVFGVTWSSPESVALVRSCHVVLTQDLIRDTGRLSLYMTAEVLTDQ